MTTNAGFGLETAGTNAPGGSSPATPAIDEATQIVVAHLVAKETEPLQAEIATLKDALEVSKAETAAAVKEFEDFKADLAAQAEKAKLVETRKAEVAKVLPALEATDERVERWASMDEAAFASYLADVAAAAGSKTPEGGTKPFDETNAESAMDRSRKTNEPSGDAARAVLGL